MPGWLQGATGTPKAGGGPGGCGAIADELAGVVMGFTDTNGLYGFNPTLIVQPGHLWEIKLCVQRGKKYRFIAQILLMVFLSRKKQFCIEVIWLLEARGRPSTAIESWNILSWEGPTWVIKSSSWPCRGHAWCDSHYHHCLVLACDTSRWAGDSKQRWICTSRPAHRCSRQDQGTRQSSSSKTMGLLPTNLLKYKEGTRPKTFSPQAQDKPGGRKLNQSQQMEASRAVPGKTRHVCPMPTVGRCVRSHLAL